ncbi:hypothetical protein M3650_02760 [Paenibacillus sp. MER TA 81-3]|uniref:hypothetical protein n=1 Tax=Paenibacillus sp. MER TA 81-3 TaxID=2939573 RepID=UPI00203ADD4F|nr:hypothetical protein [Paenibacillus sp. MER TA 81-3]MCM3337593.1 hypothetical protein [Paenibacillus sp. MER TA 81-3]
MRKKDKDYEALFNYEELAPHAKLAVPTAEHFVPFFIALGSGNPEDEAQVIYRSYDRVLSYLSLQF